MGKLYAELKGFYSVVMKVGLLEIARVSIMVV